MDQLFAVAEMQADGWLFEDVEVLKADVSAAFAVTCETVGELGHEFEPLGFAAGERG